MAKPPVKKGAVKSAKETIVKKATQIAEKYPKTTKGAKFIGKRGLPVWSAIEVGKAVKEKRYGDVVGAAAWATIPTGIAFESTKLAIEQNKGKPIPKGAQIRFGLTPSGKPRGK